MWFLTIFIFIIIILLFAFLSSRKKIVEDYTDDNNAHNEFLNIVHIFFTRVDDDKNILFKHMLEYHHEDFLGYSALTYLYNICKNRNSEECKFLDYSNFKSLIKYNTLKINSSPYGIIRGCFNIKHFNIEQQVDQNDDFIMHIQNKYDAYKFLTIYPIVLYLPGVQHFRIVTDRSRNDKMTNILNDFAPFGNQKYYLHLKNIDKNAITDYLKKNKRHANAKNTKMHMFYLESKKSSYIYSKTLTAFCAVINSKDNLDFTAPLDIDFNAKSPNHISNIHITNKTITISTQKKNVLEFTNSLNKKEDYARMHYIIVLSTNLIMIYQLYQTIDIPKKYHLVFKSNTASLMHPIFEIDSNMSDALQASNRYTCFFHVPNINKVAKSLGYIY